MKKIQEFIDSNNQSSIDFLRDAMAYYNSRTEARNEGKPLKQLLLEYIDIRGISRLKTN